MTTVEAITILLGTVGYLLVALQWWSLKDDIGRVHKRWDASDEECDRLGQISDRQVTNAKEMRAMTYTEIKEVKLQLKANCSILHLQNEKIQTELAELREIAGQLIYARERLREDEFEANDKYEGALVTARQQLLKTPVADPDEVELPF